MLEQCTDVCGSHLILNITMKYCELNLPTIVSGVSYRYLFVSKTAKTVIIVSEHWQKFFKTDCPSVIPYWVVIGLR